MAARLAHAESLVLYGPTGIGLSTLARSFFTADAEPGTVFTILPEKKDQVDVQQGVIPIERIRQLYTTLRSTAPKTRTVIIEYAERMGLPAQNAFLKLLEEPPVSTRFILLTHSLHALLPTIQSRVRAIEVKPIDQEATDALLTDLFVHDAKKRTQLAFIAHGLPGELTRLAQDEAYFVDRAECVTDARQFIAGSSYVRLLLAKKYAESRDRALIFLEDAMNQLKASLARTRSERTLAALSQLETAHQRIREQANIRLQLSALVAL